MPASKKRSKAEPTYARYIHNICKKQCPDLGVSNNAIMACNGVLETLLARLIKQSATVAKKGKIGTLKARQVQAGTRVLLPFDLSKQAVSNGTSAVTRYTSTK